MVFKKSLPVFSKAVVVDKTTGEGVIKGIVIVQEGIDKCGDFIPETFIDTLVSLGNDYPQGIKCRFGHPNMCADSLGDYIGRYKNFSKQTIDGKILATADLYLDPVGNKSPTKPGLFDWITEMADKNPDMFGNSIVFTATSEEKTMNVNGEDQTVFELTLESFIASDLVDSPAATTNLFKSSTDLGVRITVFLDENGDDLFQAIDGNPKMLGDFLDRYNSYRSRKSKLDKQMKTEAFKKKESRASQLLKSLGDWFKSDRKAEPVIPEVEVTKANIEAPTEDGRTLLVEDPDGDGVIMPGDKVTIDGAPVPAGDVPMADGTTVTVDDNSTVTGVAPDKTMADDVQLSVDESKILKKSLLDSRAANAKLQKTLSEQQEALDNLLEQVEFVGKSVKSTHVPKPKDAPLNNPNNGQESDMEKAVREKREKRAEEKKNFRAK